MAVTFLYIAVGLIPTVSMLMTSFLFYGKLELSDDVEASISSFCGGLILGAVIDDIIPLLPSKSSGMSSMHILLSCSIGLILCLSLLHGAEAGIGMIVKYSNVFYYRQVDASLSSHGGTVNYSSIDGNATLINAPLDKHKANAIDTVMTSNTDDVSSNPESVEQEHWDDQDVQRSTQLLDDPEHKDKIKQQFYMLYQLIESMESSIKSLIEEENDDRTYDSPTQSFTTASSSSSAAASAYKTSPKTVNRRSISSKSRKIIRKSEITSEKIDEEVHKFQYNLDRAKRLLQGSEANNAMVIMHDNQAIQTIQTEEVKNKINTLKLMLIHLQDHMNAMEYDIFTVREMYDHLDEMDAVLNTLHIDVEVSAYKWKKIKSRLHFPIPLGSMYIPTKLYIPVIIDCILDGLLIGVSTAINIQAGVTLAFATTIEMGSLGAAYAMRIKRCSRSSVLAQYGAIVCPPVIMFLSSIFGLYAGKYTQSEPFYFTVFVSFGVCALMHLVLTDLLVVLKDGHWKYVTLFFLGVYPILISNRC